ncbi:hypothetical protein BCR44DRAFT_266846 [Catenaria anguillulae PL171]|uniref:Uncharacterized protein n=1 Tax=Catenaria anguillulae PL171 TaxID=765915 RepID=A0A1Y2HBQ4_9FUNG|nr:hypothetical protein BCR44DRAFT_266846 [Catenaria anguillulae PL171]
MKFLGFTPAHECTDSTLGYCPHLKNRTRIYRLAPLPVANHDFKSMLAHHRCLGDHSSSWLPPTLGSDGDSIADALPRMVLIYLCPCETRLGGGVGRRGPAHFLRHHWNARSRLTSRYPELEGHVRKLVAIYHYLECILRPIGLPQAGRDSRTRPLRSRPPKGRPLQRGTRLVRVGHGRWFRHSMRRAGAETGSGNKGRTLLPAAHSTLSGSQVGAKGTRCSESFRAGTAHFFEASICQQWKG